MLHQPSKKLASKFPPVAEATSAFIINNIFTDCKQTSASGESCKINSIPKLLLKLQLSKWHSVTEFQQLTERPFCSLGLKAKKKEMHNYPFNIGKGECLQKRWRQASKLNETGISESSEQILHLLE